MRILFHDERVLRVGSRMKHGGRERGKILCNACVPPTRVAIRGLQSEEDRSMLMVPLQTLLHSPRSKVAVEKALGQDRILPETRGMSE
jgi:hypothetical protein